MHGRRHSPSDEKWPKATHDEVAPRRPRCERPLALMGAPGAASPLAAIEERSVDVKERSTGTARTCNGPGGMSRVAEALPPHHRQQVMAASPDTPCGSRARMHGHPSRNWRRFSILPRISWIWFQLNPVGAATWPIPHSPSQRHESLVVNCQEVVHAQALCEGVPTSGL